MARRPLTVHRAGRVGGRVSPRLPVAGSAENAPHAPEFARGALIEAVPQLEEALQHLARPPLPPPLAQRREIPTAPSAVLDHPARPYALTRPQPEAVDAAPLAVLAAATPSSHRASPAAAAAFVLHPEACLSLGVAPRRRLELMRLVIVALSPQPISLALLGLTLAALVEGDATLVAVRRLHTRLAPCELGLAALELALLLASRRAVALCALQECRLQLGTLRLQLAVAHLTSLTPSRSCRRRRPLRLRCCLACLALRRCAARCYRLPRLSSLLELRLERRRFTRRLLARVGRFALCRISRLQRRCFRRATRFLLCRSRHLELPLSLRRLARSGRSLQLAHLALCRELTVALVGTEACGQIAHPIVSTAHLILPLFASPLLLLRPLPRQHAPLCLLVPLAPFRSFLSSPRLLIARVRLNPSVHCRPLFRHPRAPLCLRRRRCRSRSRRRRRVQRPP